MRLAATLAALLLLASPAAADVTGALTIIQEAVALATTEAELETQLTDVSDVFTDTDGSLSDDDLSDDSITALSDVTAISGDTTVVGTTSGTLVDGNLAAFDASGNIVDSGGSGGSSIILDLADDDTNESTALGEIATSGDTNSIFTEPTADKLLIDASLNWPSADAATTAGGIDQDGDGTEEVSSDGSKLSFDPDDDGVAESEINTGGSGSSNTLLGLGSGASLTSGDFNLMMGKDAGASATTGRFNTFVGRLAGNAVTSNDSNTFVGSAAGWKTTGTENTYVGAGAGKNSNGVAGNAFFGRDAGVGVTSGSGNTFLGADSGFNITTSSLNTFIGLRSGKLVAAGTANQTTSNSVVIGPDTRVSADGVTNETVIGYEAIGQGSNTVTLGDDNVTDVYASEDADALVHLGQIAKMTPTDSPPTCDASTEGGIYYDDSLNEHCACNGATPSWNQLDGGGAC